MNRSMGGRLARLAGLARLERLPPVVWWGLLGAWLAATFVVSHQPHLTLLPDLLLLDYLLRKAGHFVVFGVLAVLAWQALRSSRVGHPVRWALVGASCYAILDEIHQGFVVGRVPYAGDVLVDVAGAAVALFLVVRWVRESQSGEA